jgi:hypothetical protein
MANGSEYSGQSTPACTNSPAWPGWRSLSVSDSAEVMPSVPVFVRLLMLMLMLQVILRSATRHGRHATVAELQSQSARST